MPKERVTLKKIAEKLGVSVPTVSRALKDYPDISKETKAAVLKLVDELNYIPNSLALNLRKNKSNIIGVIIPEVVHFFFSSVVKGIMSYADDNGYSVLLTQSEEKIEQEKKRAKLLYTTHVDGLLVCLSDETRSFDHFNIFKEYNIPMVLYDKVSQDYEGSHVVVNDYEGAFQATEHLIHQGCGKILFLRGTNEPLNAAERYRGYIGALKAYDIDIDSERILSCHSIARNDAYDVVKRQITNGSKFDGIVCISDLLAVGALAACQDTGISVPDDVCIIGFSDSEMCQIVRPKLSSVYQPGFEIGRRATELLIKEIEDIENDRQCNYQKIVLDTNLKIRESSNKVRKALKENISK